MLADGTFSDTPVAFWYGGEVVLTASVEALEKILLLTGVTADIWLPESAVESVEF